MVNPGSPGNGCLFPKTHFFRLLGGLSSIGSPTAPYAEDKERPKKAAGSSRSVGGGFNKRGNLLTRLVLSGHKTKRSRHLPAPNLNSLYTEAFTWVRLIFSLGGLNTSLSQGCILGTAPAGGTVDRTYIPRTGERVRTLRLPGFSLWVNQQVTSP